jgi:hypothetical protein
MISDRSFRAAQLRYDAMDPPDPCRRHPKCAECDCCTECRGGCTKCADCGEHAEECTRCAACDEHADKCRCADDDGEDRAEVVADEDARAEAIEVAMEQRRATNKEEV